ncbi:MAG: hypothetical protein N4A43_04405 [Alphaproteobacteria bacterium]|jgi:hypothetical protein|nr:hypothetical protein [Alphaproteobacteria bacterium]
MKVCGIKLFIAGITQDEYNKKREQIDIDKYNIEQRLNRFEEADDKFETTLYALLDMASKSSALFDSSDSVTKRKIIKLVFSNWKYNNGKLEYDYNSSFKLVANLGNCEKWLGILSCCIFVIFMV